MIIYSIVLMMSVFLLSYSSKNTILNNDFYAKFLFWVMLVAVSLNTAMRSLDYVDTRSYVEVFSQMRHISFSESLNYFGGEKIFNSLTWALSRITQSDNLYLFVMWLFFALPFVNMLKNMFKPWQATILFFTYLNFPFFLDYTHNVIRQGVAVAILLYALSLWLNDSKGKKFYVSLILAPLFHWTGLPFSIILLVVTKFKFRLRNLIIVWLALILAFLTGVNNQIVKPIWSFIPEIESYTSNSVVSNYGQVNRIDFLLFSVFWLLVSIIFLRYFCNDARYLKIVKLYVMFNSVFLLLGFVAYSDRIAIYSWFLIPLLVWVPLLNSKKYFATLAAMVILTSFIVGIVTNGVNNYNLFYMFSPQ